MAGANLHQVGYFDDTSADDALEQSRIEDPRDDDFPDLQLRPDDEADAEDEVEDIDDIDYEDDDPDESDLYEDKSVE